MTQATTESVEQKQVLEMLAEGKIGVEDAQKLLDKLRSVTGPESTQSSKSTPPRYLRIVASEGEGEDSETVNVRIPLGLVRAGLAINSFLPKWLRQRTVIIGAGVGNVNLAEFLDFENLEESLEELDLSLDDGDGDYVRIFTE